MATRLDVRAYRAELEITWTEDGHCPGCDCCDQIVCVAAFLATNTTCCAYVAAGHAPHLADARVGPRCPCTSGVTGAF